MTGIDRVSVIIPCRDAARYLAAALASVGAQSRPADEVIVIDDGSTDDSAAIAAATPGVRLLRQAPHGIGAARNAGLAEATGSVIGFLDADDLWPPDSLRRRLEALAADPPLAGVVGRVEQFLSPELLGCTAFAMPAEPMVARLAGAMLLRRTVFDLVGGFEPVVTLGETIDLVARIDEAGLRLATLDEVVLRRRVHGANTVLTQRDKQVDYLRVLKAALDRRRAAAT
jgi:glycosyltransferase involved in cell wall biosynthesis